MKVHKGIAALLTALLTAVTSIGSANAEPTNGTATPGQLKIGIEIAYPPFEYYEGSEIKGFDPELARALGKQMGAEVTFVDTKFQSLIIGLASGRFDAVISGIYIKPERLVQNKAIPYARTGASLLAPTASSFKPKNLEDLCGAKVAVQQGATWTPVLVQFSNTYCKTHGKSEITLSEFPSAPEALQALMSNNVQAQIEVAVAAHSLAAKSSGRVQITSTELIDPQSLGIFVKKNNAALYDSLVKALGQVKQSGDYDKLIKKYNLQPAEKAS